MIKSVDSSINVDTSRMKVDEIHIGNERLRADPPLRFKVGYLELGICYHLDGELGLSLHAFSQGELKSALIESFECWWWNYALEEESRLSSGARKLKQELISRFQAT